MAVEPDAHDEHVAHDEQYEEAKRRVEAKKGFYIHAFFFVLLNVIFLAAVGWDFLWATVFWGLGLVLHGASVFFSASDWVRRWEHRAIQKELERQKTGGAPPAATTGARTGASAAPPPPPKAPTPPRPPQPDDTTPKPTAPRT